MIFISWELLTSFLSKSVSSWNLSFHRINGSISFAFHCLIFKVRFRLPCGRLFFILPHRFRFVNYFFRSRDFFRCPPPFRKALSKRLIYLTTFLSLLSILFWKKLSFLFFAFFRRKRESYEQRKTYQTVRFYLCRANSNNIVCQFESPFLSS